MTKPMADEDRGPVEEPNKTEEERLEALMHGDTDTAELPEDLKTKKPVVVGIGASAGGLEALSIFFEAIPPDTGLTFVVVTHLSPDHKSFLDELLQRHTTMPVTQVLTERVAIQPNHVYVIPPRRQLVLTDSHLQSAEFDKPRAERAPIDIFFRSLAAVHAEPIAVVLTGGGSDGALGIRSVKEAGGLVMVQDPFDAAHDSMPRSAISTGVVDVILPLRQLAAKLVEISRRRTHVPVDPNHLSPEQADALQRILAQLHTRTGHDFRAYKQSTILRRLQRRMQLTGFETLEGYLPFLRQNADEAQALLGDLLIGVTNFFRDEESWREIETKIIPRLFADRSQDEVIRVWSVGCSTGEEAYSLAILLMEHAATLEMPPQFQVFATDLDEASLSKAREGYYPDVIAADVSPERLQRHFTKEGSYYRVRREVRDAILFASHSVLRDPPFSRLDLIACRNLLIYLQRSLQDNMFEIFHYALRPGGYLYLGTSESADAAGDLFATVDKRHRIYQAREWNGHYPNLPSLPLVARNLRRPDPARRIERPFPIQEPALDRSIYEQTLEQYGPPTALIDDEGNILRLSGTAGRYLRYPDGPSTSNIVRLVREELRYELRSALFHTFERSMASVSAPVVLDLGGQERRVFISVSPRIVPGEQRLALVVFIEDAAYLVGQAAQEAEEGSDHNRRAYQQVEGEVKQLRERLQATIEEYETSNEELKAANEELQSINEEYRSTTEELETSKEELQSVNEELETVNNELKAKLEEISRAHSDLQNLLMATETAILFLDRELRIQRHTVGVEQIFNVLRADRGRPIEHLTHQLDYPHLVDDARTVLRTLTPLEHSVARSDGQGWYLTRLRPYRTIDDRIDGVVISFIDVSDLKRAEAELQRLTATLETRVQERTAELETANNELTNARDHFQALFQANPVPSAIIRLDDLVYLDVNPVYLEFYGLSRDQVVGQKLTNDVHWPDEAARRDVIATYERAGRFLNQELQIGLPNGRVRTVLASDSPLMIDGRQCTLATFIDISDRKEMEERLHDQRQALEEANAELLAARDRFRTLFQLNPVPSAIVQLTDMIYLDVNKAYLEFFGLTKEQVVGQSLFNEPQWPDTEARRQVIEEFRQSGPSQGKEYFITLASGDRRTVLASEATLELEGQPCILATFTDITERQRAEEEVRRLASELTLAEHAERQRISGILHDDLQQRLYALQVLAVAAQSSGGTPPELTAIADGLRQASDLTRRLSVDMAPPILNGESLYHAILWLSSEMKEQFGLTVDVTLVPPWQMLDEGLRIVLFQVVRELLFNVTKHANVNEAAVTLQQVEETIVVEVRDNGVGFDAGVMLAQPTARGHGLGMIQQRVDLYGGRVKISATPGGGTTAVITVPMDIH